MTRRPDPADLEAAAAGAPVRSRRAAEAARDPFFRNFFARIPRDVADSFTDAQLDAIKRAFGARSWGSHAVDIRWSLPAFWSRFYLVVLLGRERRSAERLAAEGRAFGTLGNALVTLFVLFLLLTPTLYALYLVKNAVGLDLVHAGGLHEAWDTFWRQVERLFR